MHFKTKKLFGAMCVAMATTYGVDAVGEQFSVTPAMAQELSDAIVEQSTFLGEINLMPVTELQGQKVLGSANDIAPKRTNTGSGDRQTTSLLALGSKDYQLYKQEYDVHMPYATIDSWAKFPEFNDKYGQWVRAAIARARLKTGWLGTTAPTYTSANDYTDSNIGWLQALRAYESGKQVIVDGATNDVIKIGTGGDYNNLDAAVHDVKRLIHINHRGDNDLVAILGVDLVDEDHARIYSAFGTTPSEKQKAKEVIDRITYAGLPHITPEFFPPRGILVTSVKNLSIYYQDTAVRRQVIDNPKRDRVEDFNSSNDGYIIENEEKAAMIDFNSVQLPDGAGWS